MNRTLIALAAALAWSGFVFYGGYTSGDAQRNAQWLDKEAQYQRQAKEDLLAAQARGDALTTGLMAQQDQITLLRSEKQNAIKAATTGRACLGADALRVLDTAPGITVAGPAEATSITAAAGEAAAPDTNVSTDTNIALWIIDAGADYEVCRTHLDALIDWNLGK